MQQARHRELDHPLNVGENPALGLGLFLPLAHLGLGRPSTVARRHTVQLCPCCPHSPGTGPAEHQPARRARAPVGGPPAGRGVSELPLPMGDSFKIKAGAPSPEMLWPEAQTGSKRATVTAGPPQPRGVGRALPRAHTTPGTCFTPAELPPRCLAVPSPRPDTEAPTGAGARNARAGPGRGPRSDGTPEQRRPPSGKILLRMLLVRRRESREGGGRQCRGH